MSTVLEGKLIADVLHFVLDVVGQLFAKTVWVLESAEIAEVFGTLMSNFCMPQSPCQE